MIIETEPADLLMVRFKFYFDQQHPDPEDSWVLAYLDECGLEPRRQFEKEHEGVLYKVMHFGQCYLGRHVPHISNLYKRGIEHSVLAHHILEVLQNPAEPAVHAAATSLEAATLQALATTLAQQLYEQAQFQETAERQLQVEIDATVVHQAFSAWQATQESPA
jgi:hypothetical protein